MMIGLIGVNYDIVSQKNLRCLGVRLAQLVILGVEITVGGYRRLISGDVFSIENLGKFYENH